VHIVHFKLSDEKVNAENEFSEIKVSSNPRVT